MSTIPIIVMDGATAYERGVQYGTQAKEYIAICLEYYKNKFVQQGNAWTAVQRYAEQFVPIVKETYPEQWEELEGIAQGSGVTTNDLMIINSRYEISKFPKLPECTTGAVLPEASANGGTYSFKNWDLDERVLPHVVALDIKTETGLHIIGISEAGQMLRDGVNNYGLSIGNNNLQSLQDTYGVGIPVTFMRRRVLCSKTFEEAEEIILNSKRTVSGNIMLIDGKQGFARDYECYPSGTDTIAPMDGILTHANHFVVEPELDALIDRPKNRDARMRELLLAHRGKLNVELIEETLKDHKYYPLSICAHPDHKGNAYVKHRMTITSMIVAFKEQKIYMCLGQPCCNEYIAVDF